MSSVVPSVVPAIAADLLSDPGIDAAQNPQALAVAAATDRRGGMARLSPVLRAVAAGAAALDAIAPTLSTELMLRHFTRPRRKPGGDYREQLPDGCQRIELDHDGDTLTGWVWGAGTSGPSALLVHGWEDHSGSMLSFVQPLRRLGYVVYALDAPGHGLSPRVATHLLDTSIALERMVGAFGPFASIVAHSYGAAATCLMIERNPALTPERLSLIAPMQDLDQHLQVFADIALLSPARAARLRDRVEMLIGRPTREICALRAAGRIRVPSLVIHDAHDPVIPVSSGVSIARQLPGARFFPTARLGHRRVLKCQNVLGEILRHHRA
ncbi:MAG: alpha/beta fold hydrolase [Halieaceae bacterium]|jgi:omega-6 fatty acid desaturase (delta-12 desaturase)|nr:alpha/beta fold hydrolase [Halieaceae bacterium]